MKFKLTIIFLILALVVTNAYWLFAIVDQGVTLTYTEDSFETAQKQYEQTVILANLQLIGSSAEEAMKKIGKDVYGLEPFIKEGCLWAGEVCLLLEDGRVSRIGRGPR